MSEHGPAPALPRLRPGRGEHSHGGRRPVLARAARQALTHPVDRVDGDTRGRFERLAEYGSLLASSPLIFAVGLLVVLVWLGGLIAAASDRFEAVAAGLISALTLVVVTLLKNAELRSERATQRKLDAIASSLLEDKRGSDRSAEHDLEHTIGVHEQI